MAQFSIFVENSGNHMDTFVLDFVGGTGFGSAYLSKNSVTLFPNHNTSDTLVSFIHSECKAGNSTTIVGIMSESDTSVFMEILIYIPDWKFIESDICFYLITNNTEK